jgi:hypothetical protein
MIEWLWEILVKMGDIQVCDFGCSASAVFWSMKEMARLGVQVQQTQLDWRSIDSTDSLIQIS